MPSSLLLLVCPRQAAGQGHREGPRLDGGGEAGAESEEHRPELQGCPGEVNVHEQQQSSWDGCREQLKPVGNRV